jgi:hypothetical protein
MGPIGCPEAPVDNYHYTLRNFTEELRSINSICTVTYRDLNVIANLDTATETRRRTLRPKLRMITDVVLITGRTERIEFY